MADEERTRQLVQRGAATRQELERIQAQREDAEVQRDSARAQLAQVEANLELMELELARAHITAPAAGVVVQRPAVVGAHVGTNSVIATIVGIDPIEVSFHLPEREMGKVHEGQAIRVSVDAFPERSFAGEVNRLGAAIETRTRTLPVWGRVPNDDLALRPGMFARVELVLEGKNNVLTVPREAILLSSGQEPFVYVVENGRAVARPVVRGLEGSDRVEIVEGLQEGDEVVVVGQHRLRWAAPSSLSPMKTWPSTKGRAGRPRRGDDLGELYPHCCQPPRHDDDGVPGRRLVRAVFREPSRYRSDAGYYVPVLDGEHVVQRCGAGGN